jgi:putative tricarboxylic transport membrane protein
VIIEGLELLFRPDSLLWLLAGLCLGFVVGVLPGLSTSNTAALLLPFSIGLPTESALILIVSIYAGSAFAGSVPAILVKVPGEAGSAVTALDGYQMTKRGKAGLAIGISRMASTLGGVLSGVVILFVIGPLGALALRFGAREMFLVVVLGLIIVATLIGKNVWKGLLSGALGLVLATVGGSPLTAQSRFTFGQIELFDGIQFVPALIGVFAVSEMLLLIAGSRAKPIELIPREGGIRGEIKDAVDGAKATLKKPGQVLQSSFVGMILGIIPGIGTGISNFISYSIAKRTSKQPDSFGKGATEGIIASEACDNAVCAATLVPTLALGVPGSATMAVILAQLYIQGIQPGPRVLVTHGAEATAAIMAIVLASILILPLGIVLIAPMIQITKVPLKFLVPIVLLLAFAGTFAYRASMFDVLLAAGFGVLGLVMRLHGYPVIPLILGLILGPLAEEHLTRALTLGNTDFAYMFESPTAIVLWVLIAATIAFFAYTAVRQGRREKLAETTKPDSEKAVRS